MAPHKKKSPWISDRELKKMTADKAPPPLQEPTYDDGTKLDPNLFWAWEGERAAPPIWHERPVYKNPNLQGTISKWREKVVVSFSPKSFEQSRKESNEIAPRAWIPNRFESGQTLQTFWEQQMHDEHCKPFWDCYVSPHTAIQRLLVHPEQRGCDPTQGTPQDREAHEKEQGSQGWTNQYLWNPNTFMKKHFGRKAGGKVVRDDEPPMSASFISEEAPVDMTIKPKLNSFIRMATVIDVPQLTNIYNHYVKNSVCTPELDSITIHDMADRLKNVREANLPFIVCCSMVGYGNRRKKTPPIDMVLGMAFADDLCGPKSALRFSVEAAVFVAPTSLRNGVSKCLMDKLLGLLDQFYTERAGYDVDERLGLGAQRLVSRIVLNYMHSPDDDNKEWMVPYLESWGFEQSGLNEGIAYKLNKVVDNMIFLKATGLVIVPTNPPQIPS